MKLQKTTKKRFFAMLLSLAMVFTMLPTAAFAQEPTQDETLWVGTGTESDPYQISSEALLWDFAGKVNNAATNEAWSDKFYVLTQDITLHGAWTAIGETYDTAFRGTFDGQNHAISGLTVQTETGYTGLFGVVQAKKGELATIKNLRILAPQISGYACGGLAACLWNSDSPDMRFNTVIENCAVVGGTVTGIICGGLIGDAEYAKISGCSSSAAVQEREDLGNSAGGGLLAELKGNVAIECSFATGTVSGFAMAGGLVGKAAGAALLANCYATGAVSGTIAGGLGGIIDKLSTENEEDGIYNCFATGDVTAQGEAGGLAGQYAGGINCNGFVALCKNVTGGYAELTGRLAGDGNIADYTFADAYADSEMLVNGSKAEPGTHDYILNGEDFSYTAKQFVDIFKDITTLDGTTVKATDVWTFRENDTPIFKVGSIQFDARNGVSIADVEIGDSMTLPANPTWGDNEAKNNYTFKGWYTGIDGAGDLVINIDGTFVEGKKPTASTTLCAKWTKDGKTVVTTPLDFTTDPVSAIPADSGIVWDNNTKTLSLNAATIDCSGVAGSTFTVNMPDGATISMTGDSTILGGNTTDSTTVGVQGNESLTFDGSGTLHVTAGDSSNEYGQSVAIGVKSNGTGTLTFLGGTVHADSGSNTKEGTGISVSATNDNATTNYGVIVNGGTVYATGRGTTRSIGVTGYPSPRITVLSGYLGAFATDGTQYGYGVCFYNGGSIKASGGTIDLVGKTQSVFGLNGKMDTGAGSITGSTDQNATSLTAATYSSLNYYITDNSTFDATTICKKLNVSFDPTVKVAYAGSNNTSVYGVTAAKTFSVTDMNFESGKVPTTYTAAWCNSNGTTTGTPASAGVLAVGEVTTGDATLTLTPSATAGAGTYYFKVIGGNVNSNVITYTITKATPAAPAQAPTVQSKTDTTVTLDTVAGQQYAIRIGTDTTSELVWQDSGVFENLTAKTAYNVYTRIKADDNHNASAASTAASVTTKVATVRAPAAPTVKTGANAPTANSITIATVLGLEYVISTSSTAPTDWSNAVLSIDGSDYSFTGLTAETQYYIYVRLPGADDAMPSASANTAQYTAAAAPTAGVGYTINYTTEKISITTGYEVSTDSTFTDGTKTVANNSIIAPNTTYYVRKAASSSIPASVSASFTTAIRPVAPTTVTKTDETVKGKGNGKVSGVTTAMEYSTDNGSTWTTGDGTDITLAVGDTIKVRVKATSTAPYGAEKSFTGVASTTTLTVTFNVGGGSAVSNISNLSYNDRITAPSEPTKSNSYFVGWFSDKACKTAYNFSDKVTDNMTLYASWSDTTPITGITGIVTQDGINVANARVELRKGNEVVASVTTETNGNYSFTNVPAGIYNIVVTGNGKTITKKVTIETTTQTVNVQLPTDSVSSEVVVKDDTPATVIDGLDEVAAENAESGKTVVVTLTAESKESTDLSKQETDAFGRVASGKTLVFLDLSLTKTVDGGIAQALHSTNSLIEILIPFNSTGKQDIVIYRWHDANNNSVVDDGETIAMTKNPASGEEGFTLGEDGYIHIFTKNFSTYAIGYVEPKTITFDANGGSVTPSSAETNSEYKLDTLPTPTRSGSYSFDGWYTAATGGIKITTETVFDSDSTIYAHWANTGNNNDNNDNNDNNNNNNDNNNNSNNNNDANIPTNDNKNNTQGDNTASTNSVQTGDDSNAAVWMLLLLLSALGLAGLGMYRKKELDSKNK